MVYQILTKGILGLILLITVVVYLGPTIKQYTRIRHVHEGHLPVLVFGSFALLSPSPPPPPSFHAAVGVVRVLGCQFSHQLGLFTTLQNLIIIRTTILGIIRKLHTV